MKFHLGIIPDGNRRFDREHPELAEIGGAYAHGGEAAIRAAAWFANPQQQTFDMLTIYGFAEANWSRPASDVADAMQAAEKFLLEAKRGITEKAAPAPPTFVRAVGEARAAKAGDDLSRVQIQIVSTNPKRIPMSITELDDSIHETGIGIVHEVPDAAKTINVLASYSSKDEMRKACGDPDRLLVKRPIDAVFRTSGEMRLSDFCLHQCAYAELFFSDKLWPEIEFGDLDAIADAISKRNRRFGK